MTTKLVSWQIVSILGFNESVHSFDSSLFVFYLIIIVYSSEPSGNPGAPMNTNSQSSDGSDLGDSHNTEPKQEPPDSPTLNGQTMVPRDDLPSPLGHHHPTTNPGMYTELQKTSLAQQSLMSGLGVGHPVVSQPHTHTPGSVNNEVGTFNDINPFNSMRPKQNGRYFADDVS